MQALKWLEAGDNSTTVKDDHTLYVGYNLFVLELLGRTSGYKYFGRMTGIPRSPIASWRFSGRTVHSAGLPTASIRSSRRHTRCSFWRGGESGVHGEASLRWRWANRPRDLAGLTRFASREFERNLNWQAVPISHDWTDWLDSPVLYIASNHDLPLQDEEIGRLRSYVQSGGMLLTHADADSPEFTQYVEQVLAARLFPQYPMSDVPENDPIYSTQYSLKPPLPKLRGVSNGSRWLLIHSPLDRAAKWQAQSEKPARSSFELAANLFIYAAGKSDLLTRFVSPFIPEPAKPPVATLNVARLRYAGNWDPEPYAWDAPTDGCRSIRIAVSTCKPCRSPT